MIKRLNFDTYPVEIHVFVTKTDQEILDYVIENQLEHYEDLFKLAESEEAIFVYEKDYPTVYLRFRNIDYPSIVAHEAFHVVAFIMRYIGVRLSKNSEEAYAYLLQAILDKIYEEE